MLGLFNCLVTCVVGGIKNGFKPIPQTSDTWAAPTHDDYTRGIRIEKVNISSVFLFFNLSFQRILSTWILFGLSKS